MKDSIGILAPGKGWGNFVSYISCFKTISENRNKNTALMYAVYYGKTEMVKMLHQ